MRVVSLLLNHVHGLMVLKLQRLDDKSKLTPCRGELYHAELLLSSRKRVSACSECCRQVSKTPCWQELLAQDSQLNKNAKRRQETVIFSLVHPGKPGLYESVSPAA